MNEEQLKKVLALVVEAYEKTYLDATIFQVLAKDNVPHFGRMVQALRCDQKLCDFVHAKFRALGRTI